MYNGPGILITYNHQYPRLYLIANIPNYTKLRAAQTPGRRAARELLIINC